MKIVWILISITLFILFSLVIYYYKTKKYSSFEGYIFKDPSKWIWEFHDFLTRDECKKIMDDAIKHGLTRSQVKDYSVDNGYRTSETCWLSPSSSYPIIELLYNRLEQLLKIKKSNFEQLQVVRYKPGGFFKWHYDQCNEDEDWCKKEIKRFKGYRFFTALIYLNDDYEGGETEFKYQTEIKKHTQGTLIIFRNMDLKKNKIEKLSYHQGRPVTSGEKWICNIWIRGNHKNIFV